MSRRLVQNAASGGNGGGAILCLCFETRIAEGLLQDESHGQLPEQSTLISGSFSPRPMFAALFVAVVGVLGFGLYLQLAKGLLPCPLCVIQRIAFIAIAAAALMTTVFAVQRRGQLIGAVLVGLFALSGLAAAMRQVWLIRHPQLAECGISAEERLLNELPLAQWWPVMFRADGDCIAVNWTLLGLSVPELSLGLFAAIALFALFVAVRASRASWRE